jgi:hypothetical protein
MIKKKNSTYRATALAAGLALAIFDVSLLFCHSYRSPATHRSISGDTSQDAMTINSGDQNISGASSAEQDDCDTLFDPTLHQIPQLPDAPLPGQECPEFDAISILSLITIDPADPTVLPVINVPHILKHNIYLHTTGPVTRRSLLDEPALQLYCFDNDYISLTVEPFFNYTPLVYFTKNSPYIRSYIDLTNQNIINELARAKFNIGELIGQEIDIDVPGLLGLFHFIKLRQYRTGAMLGFCKQYPKFNISFFLPLYYLVEHFHLTQEEIERIENNSFFQTDEPAVASCTDGIAEEFGYQHLVSDRFGFGDSRFIASLNIYESSCSELWLGLQVTAPTARTLASGILGATFKPCAPAPQFNIKKLFNLAFCFNEGSPQKIHGEPVVQQMINSFLIGTLDRLSTILINTPLGNGHHWGFGPQLDFRYQFSDCWSAHTYAVVEGFSTHTERRFFLVRKDPEEFDRNYRIESEAEENLSFLNTQIINTFFPVGVCIGVHPGQIIKLRQSFMYDTAHWHACLGFDYWRQGREYLSATRLEYTELAIEKGLRPTAQQGKIFGALGYYSVAHHHCFAWNVQLKFDATVFNSGIGADYTFGISVGLDF